MYVRLVGAALLTAVMTAANLAEARAPVVVEVAEPPASFGADASALRAIAQGEVNKLPLARGRDRRAVVVSLALAEAGVDACTMHATVRDARSGAVIATIDAGAHTEGTASPSLRKQMAMSVTKRAIQRLPSALGGR